MREWVLRYRRALNISVHGLLFVLSYALAFVLRFDYDISYNHQALFVGTFWIVLLIKMLIFDYMGLYQIWWRYLSMNDLTVIIKASLLSSIALMAVGHLFFRDFGFPRSIPVLDFVLTVGLVGGARFLIRSIREGHLQMLIRPESQGTRVVIVGAGDAGELLAREIYKNPSLPYHLVGFLDDSPYKHRMRIHGYSVLGRVEELEKICEELEVEEIFIAIPSASGEEMKRVVGLCETTGRKIKTMPGLDRLIDGRVTVSQLREVEIEDLLGRDPVELDLQAIGQYLGGKKVLVTGAAGSIGSEICRQVLSFYPEKLILVDQWENGVFQMEQEFKKLRSQGVLEFLVADVGDRKRMLSIFQQSSPNVVFHAAAYKHVPIMEENPGEAVKNNVEGTKTLADICEELGTVNRFVMISTDKAVNPTSVMGATKRVAERYVQMLARNSKTKFITVRFGNVLGSAGSVIPIFKEQIAGGGPVTVTHPDMTRYFMTIPEAAQLVLQAGAMGKGGEIFVLDMGEPVKIVDLASLMIRLSGYKPGEDIEIEFTGIRPGEKLFEELNLDDETLSRTGHAKVFIRSSCDVFASDFTRDLDRLITQADVLAGPEIKLLIKKLVVEYQCPDKNSSGLSGPAGPIVREAAAVD